MAYKRHLYATGGYQAYSLELSARTSKESGIDPRFAEIHNGIRGAVSGLVGLTAAMANALQEGAKTSAAAGGSTYNVPNWNALQGGQSIQPSQLAVRFAQLPFTVIVKEGQGGLVLQGKPVVQKLYINPFDKDQERLLTKLFPGYKTPTEFTKQGHYSRPVLAFGAGLEARVTQDTAIKMLTGEFSPFLAEELVKSEEFESIKPLPKGMGVSLNMVIRGDAAQVAGLGYSQGLATEGAIPTTAAVHMSVEITPELHLPLDYAQWTLYCESPEEFVPFMFLTHMNAIVQAAAGATRDTTGNSKDISFTKDLKGQRASNWKKMLTKGARKPTPMAMMRRNLAKEKITGYSPMIRTNADGYSITATNHIVRIPTEGKMVEYQAEANRWFDSLSGLEVTKMAEGGRDAPKFRFPPSILMVDHHNEVMVYTTKESTVSSINLRGARALDDITISRRYPQALFEAINGKTINWTAHNGDLSVNAKILMNYIQKLRSAQDAGLNQAALMVAIGSTMKPDNLNPIISRMDEDSFYLLQNAVRDAVGYGSDTEANIRSAVATLRDGTPDESFAAKVQIVNILNLGIRNIADIALKVWTAGEKREEDAPINLVTMAAEANLYIVAKHTNAVATYIEKRRTNARDNVVDDLDRNKPIVIPNIDTKRMSFMFPHQGEFVQAVDRAEPPTSAVIGAAPGGGKTNCIMADILLLLEKGLIDRPVIVVPNNLVRQFITEINEFTNGKVNAFPFTYKHVQKVLMNPYGMNLSMAEVSKYIRDLPKNTMIVTNYNTLRNRYSDDRLKAAYEEVPSYDNFGQAKPLKGYPFVDMLAAAGVDYVCGDESHKIKNQDSDLAQAFLTLCAKAEYVRLSSGTTINNVVVDLVGQMQKVNSAILGGSVKEFSEDFLGGKNQISDPDQGLQIQEAIREYSLFMQKDSRSWDYMLPKMREIYHRVEMTPVQTRYYEVLFNKAIRKIETDQKIKGDLEKAEGAVGDDDAKVNNKIEKAVRKHFSLVDRFVNDPAKFPDFRDGSFVYEEYMIQHPDEDPPEPGSLEPAKVTPFDLVSVKATYAYKLMYAHMDMRGMLDIIRNGEDGKGGAKNFTPDSTNKVILMAPNRFVGGHLWDNMPADLKKMSVRYTAGAMDKVEVFKTDATIKFMVADETSISEGHNLQVGSRIIRMQQVWTPGGEIQSLARIRRPDPFGKFNREALGYDVIVATKPNGSPTIDDLRIARLLAKKFNNAMVEFGLERSFQNEFLKGAGSALPPVRMSMKVIKAFPEELLNRYFDQQARYNAWFLKSSLEQTRKIGREVEALTGKKLLDENGAPLNMKEFVAAVVIPTVEGKELQGSASSYVPFIEGAIPINPLGFEIQPIRSFVVKNVSEDDDDEDDDIDEDDFDEEDEDEDGNGDSLDNVEVKIGDHVLTEFGPGIITRILRNGHNLQISIPSMKPEKGKKIKEVRLPKTCVYVPTDKEGAKTLALAIKSKGGTPVRLPDSKPISPQQRDEARDRRKGNKEPPPSFTDYDEDDDFEEDDFDVDSILPDEDDEEEDPIDTLIAEEDEDGEIEEDEDEDSEEEDEQPTVFASATVVNGQIAITVDDSGDEKAGLNHVFTQYGFKAFPDMARLQFKTRKSLDIFLAKLVKGKYAIPRNMMTEIDAVASGLTNRAQLKQIEPFDYSEITNFMRTEQRKVPRRVSAADPQVFRLYPIVTSGNFYLCASISKHPFNVAQIMTRASTGIPGVGKVQKLDDMGVKFYPSIAAAKKDAKKMIDSGVVEEPEAFLESFDAINNGHIDMPAGPAPKPKADVPKAPQAKVPGEKPGLKPSQKPAKQDSNTFEEETHNPLVEDISEFKDFLQADRATLTLLKGKNKSMIGVHQRVKSYSLRNGTFTTATEKNTPKEDRLAYNIPDEDDAEFDHKRGLMMVGTSVYKLTYAG